MIAGKHPKRHELGLAQRAGFEKTDVPQAIQSLKQLNVKRNSVQKLTSNR